MFRGNPRVSRERRNSRRVTPIATNPPRSRSRHAGLGVCAALALAGRSVIAGSFALPRDADQRSAFQAVPAAAPRRLFAVSSASRRRCRAPKGGLPRGRRSAVARHPVLEGYAPRREPSRRLGRAPPRPCGPLCRCEHRRSLASAPSGVRRGCGSHGGEAQRHRRWFRAPARCRPEVGVPSRLRACSQSAGRGFAPDGRRAYRCVTWCSLPRRAAGAGCPAPSSRASGSRRPGAGTEPRLRGGRATRSGIASGSGCG